MSDSVLKEKLQFFWPAVILIVLLLANLIMFYLRQGENLDKTIEFLLNFTPTNIRDYILGYGIYAPAVVILLLIAQSLIAPIPGQLIVVAAGMIYGPIFGTIIVFIGTLIGSALCFKISEHFGRPILEKMLSKKDLEDIDSFVQGKKGFLTFLVIRLNPVMAFDIISYGAGLTKMSFKNYMIISAIALAIGTPIYTTLGSQLIEGNLVILFLISAILIGLIIGIPILKERIKD